MKKVLSVALASAMVLGMGANAFAISYSTGSNQEADWPSNFQFDGKLFVTDKDGDIIEESTTELNDSESVDFEPGDVIWMPLYADDQYVWTNTWTEGSDAEDAVSSIRLDESYFKDGVAASDAVAPTSEEVEKTVSGSVTLTADWADGETGSIAALLEVGDREVNVNIKPAGEDTATVSDNMNRNNYNKLFDTDYTEDEMPGDATLTFEVTRSDDGFSAANDSTSVDVTVVATIKEAGENAVAGEPAVLKEIPTTIEVENGDGDLVERTVESAKAVVNGKTFTEKAKNFDELVSKVNKELEKMAEAGKSAMAKDVVVTLNLAEKKATDDVVNKPHIEVADDDKVMVDYGHYTGNIDKNWSINLIEKSTGVAELIEKAELYKATATDYASYSKYTDEIMPNAVYLKITLEDTWKTVDSETLTYYVYVADNDSGKQTNEVWVSGKYVNNNWEYVDFDWTNDASKAQLWKVRKGENGTAVFDFADKAFFTVKMYSGESMYLDLSTAYDKAIAGEMDAEADSFYKFDNDNANFSRTGELIIVTDDETLVPYEIDEDGNFVEVDAKYVEDYAIAHTNKKVDGFVFSTKTLGNYVLSTEELGQEEKPAEETPAKPVTPSEPTTETPAPETSKPNPDTGAEDFVGLAVSLAVVSVAAAGALALKK